jgi:hypothetical protein
MVVIIQALGLREVGGVVVLGCFRADLSVCVCVCVYVYVCERERYGIQSCVCVSKWMLVRLSNLDNRTHTYTHIHTHTHTHTHTYTHTHTHTPCSPAFVRSCPTGCQGLAALRFLPLFRRGCRKKSRTVRNLREKACPNVCV